MFKSSTKSLMAAELSYSIVVVLINKIFDIISILHSIKVPSSLDISS